MSFFTVVSIFERIFKKNRFTRFFPVGFRFSVFCRNRLTLILPHFRLRRHLYGIYYPIITILNCVVFHVSNDQLILLMYIINNVDDSLDLGPLLGRFWSIVG